MKKNSFVFFYSWRDALSECPSEVRLEVYESIIEYAQSGTLPRLKPMAQMAFNFIKVEIDRNNEKYSEMVEKRREAGKKSRKQMLTNAANANTCYQMQQMLTNAADDVYVYDDVDDDDNVSLYMRENTRETERENFLFFLLSERHLINPSSELERFLAHYEKTGWLTSTGQKVTNRMAALKGWRCDGATFADSRVVAKWLEVTKLFPGIEKSLLLGDFRGFQQEDDKFYIYTTKPLQNAIISAITDEIRDELVKIVGVKPNWRVKK